MFSIMRKVVYAILSLCLLIGGILSCTPEYENDCPIPFTGALGAAEEKLVGQWALSAIVSDKAIDVTDDDEDNPITDIFVQYSPCQRDLVYQFGSARNYALLQRQTADSCDQKGRTDGTWKLAGSSLTLIAGCFAQSISLDFNDAETEFTFSDDFNVRDVKGVTVQADIEFTYTKNSQ